MVVTEQSWGEVVVDGLTVAYRAQGEGPPVVLLHGWPTSSHLWREVMVPIAATNRVIAPDLPGYGRSDKPLDRRYDFPLFERVLDGLTDELGIDELGLGVHDLGGPIGLHWALENPGRVTRLAILNTLVHLPDPVGGGAGSEPSTLANLLATLSDPERYQELTGRQGLAAVMRSGLGDPTRLTPELLDAVVAPFESDDAQRALAAAGTQLDLTTVAETGERLGELTMPVRVVYGRLDAALPIVEEVERIQRQLPHAEVTALDGGHFLQEDAPQLVGQHLAELFARAAPPDPSTAR